MQKKMGLASLEYRHENGMNFAHILDDLIIGSCPQSQEDVDRCEFLSMLAFCIVVKIDE